MKKRHALLAALALSTACVHDVMQVAPPFDGRERQRAEAAACWRSGLPYWMDDAALSDAARLDRREGDASRANESFQAGTAMMAAQPPPAPRPSDGGPHTSALLRERDEFQARCRLLRAGGALSP
ncbi:MAG TPA: hypothetical protein VFE30_18495 [Anaeromyxobacteraceae bacterium]|jgi:hypothetical protein|nr:hypothetical protein [Anaeromyxobacteraceae bacterium]